jgi:GTP cyclohydrolase IA
MRPETNGHREGLTLLEGGAGAIDLPGAEQAAADLLSALGADVGSEHLRETPRRVAQAYAELLTPKPFNATTFPNDEGYDELVLQESLTTQIADWLEEKLAPRGVGVIVQAEHLCMSLRGVQKPGSLTVTSALRGLVRDDARTRQEFLSLAASDR